MTGEQIETAIGIVLRVGVIASAVLVAAGGISYLLEHGGSVPPYRIFQGTATALTSMRGIVRGAMALHFRTALWHADVLQKTALLTDGMYGLLGMTVAGM